MEEFFNSLSSEQLSKFIFTAKKIQAEKKNENKVTRKITWIWSL